MHAPQCFNWGTAFCAASCWALSCALLALAQSFRWGGLTPTAADTERIQSVNRPGQV